MKGERIMGRWLVVVVCLLSTMGAHAQSLGEKRGERREKGIVM